MMILLCILYIMLCMRLFFFLSLVPFKLEGHYRFSLRLTFNGLIRLYGSGVKLQRYFSQET
jgi:hypothetical protein